MAYDLQMEWGKGIAYSCGPVSIPGGRKMHIQLLELCGFFFFFFM
jgi:hypothetical protein